MRIDNQKMLVAFTEHDPVVHYNNGKDLTYAGENYKVNAMAVFVKDPDVPLSDYITVKTYDDAHGFILVGISTKDETLLAEALDYIVTIGKEVQSIELRTTYPEILDSPVLLGRFTVEEPEDEGMNPVYYVHTAAELRDIPLSADVTVVLANEAERERARSLLSTEDEQEHELREGISYIPDYMPDVKMCILYLAGKPIGYLRGENGFANIYDIGWIQILPRWEGRGYGKQLTAWFSRYCFAHGLVPQYGFAINEASVAVAKACGYSCDPEKRVAKKLVLR